MLASLPLQEMKSSVKNIIPRVRFIFRKLFLIIHNFSFDHPNTDFIRFEIGRRHRCNFAVSQITERIPFSFFA
jgi:hypothetical protein